jgi:ABC-type phosphate transport system substrate-binding protein
MSLFKRVAVGALGVALTLTIQGSVGDVVAVVSSTSSITTLSKSELADIFMGRTSRLANGVQPVPIDQAEGSIARTEFYANMAGKSPAQMKAYWSKIIFTGRGQPPAEVSNSVEMRTRVAQNPAAIGYIEQAMLDNSVKVVVSR